MSRLDTKTAVLHALHVLRLLLSSQREIRTTRVKFRYIFQGNSSRCRFFAEESVFCSVLKFGFSDRNVVKFSGTSIVEQFSEVQTDRRELHCTASEGPDGV